jgi:hypothetical protein
MSSNTEVLSIDGDWEWAYPKLAGWFIYVYFMENPSING